MNGLREVEKKYGMEKYRYTTITTKHSSLLNTGVNRNLLSIESDDRIAGFQVSQARKKHLHKKRAMKETRKD